MLSLKHAISSSLYLIIYFKYLLTELFIQQIVPWWWWFSHQVVFDSCNPMDSSLVHQVPVSMGIPRQEYWSGSPLPSPGDLPNPGIEPRSTLLKEISCIASDSLPGFPGGSAGKESSCNVGDLGLIPGLGRSPGEGISYSVQYSGLENFVNCKVHGVTKSWTRLSNFYFHFLC